MNNKQALKLAIAVMSGKYPTLKDVTFEANRYKMLEARDHGAIRAHEQYLELVAAIAEIEAMMSQRELF